MLSIGDASELANKFAVKEDKEKPKDTSKKTSEKVDSKEKPNAEKKETTGKSEHEALFGDVYINDIGKEAMLTAKYPSFSVGTIIIRKTIKMFNALNKDEGLTVMVKREKGFNPENGDWEFLVIEGDMSKIRQREKTGSCVQCHSRQKANDFVFRSYLSEDVRSKLK